VAALFAACITQPAIPSSIVSGPMPAVDQPRRVWPAGPPDASPSACRPPPMGVRNGNPTITASRCMKISPKEIVTAGRGRGGLKAAKDFKFKFKI